MVRDLSEQGKFGHEEGEDAQRRAALEILSSGLENSEAVRAILGRDPGNVFGIWEEGEGEESEMYGWGAYVFGSFFNHGKYFLARIFHMKNFCRKTAILI